MRKEFQVKTEAETRVMLPSAKECLDYQSWNRQETMFIRGFIVNIALLYLEFRLLASRTIREYNSAVSSHSVCVILLQLP